VAETVGRQSYTTLGQFRFQACPFEIFVGQTGTGTWFLFSLSTSGFPCHCRATKFLALIDLRRYIIIGNDGVFFKDAFFN
jgi:hypothetical protein